MLVKHLKFIYNIYKSAAADIPAFYPEWVKKHPELEKVQKLSDIPKEIPISDFREPIYIDLFDSAKKRKIQDVEAFCDHLVLILNKFLKDVENEESDDNPPNLSNELIAIRKLTNSLIESINPEVIKSEFEKTDKLSQVLNIHETIKADYEFDAGPAIGIVRKHLVIPAGTNIINACRLLSNYFTKSTGKTPNTPLRNITELETFKAIDFLVSKKFKTSLEKKSQDPEFEIVFSKHARDLLSMSIRSDWTSCQNLLKDQDTLNTQAIYAATSKYTGIIYLTNKKQYEGRGEEMIARSLVFYVINDSGNGAITFGEMQSNFDTTSIQEMFKSALKKHTSLPIIEDTTGYYFPVESDFIFERPYFGKDIETRMVQKKKETQTKPEAVDEDLDDIFPEFI